MKTKIYAYGGLVFFGLVFGFLIWGLVNIISAFYGSSGIFTFLSVILPNVIALGYIGFNLVVFILKVKKLPKKQTPPSTDTKTETPKV